MEASIEDENSGGRIDPISLESLGIAGGKAFDPTLPFPGRRPVQGRLQIAGGWP